MSLIERFSKTDTAKYGTSFVKENGFDIVTFWDWRNECHRAVVAVERPQDLARALVSIYEYIACEASYKSFEPVQEGSISATHLKVGSLAPVYHKYSSFGLHGGIVFKQGKEWDFLEEMFKSDDSSFTIYAMMKTKEELLNDVFNEVFGDELRNREPDES